MNRIIAMLRTRWCPRTAQVGVCGAEGYGDTSRAICLPGRDGHDVGVRKRRLVCKFQISCVLFFYQMSETSSGIPTAAIRNLGTISAPCAAGRLESQNQLNIQLCYEQKNAAGSHRQPPVCPPSTRGPPIQY
jgi:hypothetical protein